MPAALTPNPVYVQQANGQVLVSWGSSAGATSYSVQRSTDGTTFSNVASPTTLQFLDTTVIPAPPTTIKWHLLMALEQAPTAMPNKLRPS